MVREKGGFIITCNNCSLQDYIYMDNGKFKSEEGFFSIKAIDDCFLIDCNSCVNTIIKG